MYSQKLPLVSIIIVTRNRKQFVIACLDSVFKTKYTTLEVIVIDNNSEDNTTQAIKEKFPKVRLIEAKTNLGLNGGKNLGQKQATGKYLFFLDSDTVVDKKILNELIHTAESYSQFGLVCPKMYYFERIQASSSNFFDKKNVLWYAGAKVNLLTSQTKNIGANEEDHGQYDQIRETDFAPTAYLTPKKLADKLGGHEETFFMTYGDTDYGLRVKEAGFKVIFCPQAKLWHRLNQEENINSIRALGYNLPLRAYYFARNRVLFMKRHASKLNFLIFVVIFFPLMTIYFTYKIIVFKGGWKFLKPHLEGTLDGLKYALGEKIENKWT